jgi:hypothetical protein
LKPRNEVLKIQGSLGGEITRMQLDSNAVVHIMSVLTNLYSDTEKAIIREYSTNALDSHIFAGVTDPIEVTLPNQLSSDLVIRDFGLGLSKDEIQNVYGTYGTSTKRDSDDVAGCLGLGSKSALAYTNSFSVVGVKDGMRTTAVVGLDEDGAGRIEVVDESETTERNGVTVSIPISTNYYFADKVRKFFSYWEKGTVLIDGEEPKHFSENLTRIDESVWYSPKDYGIVIVMGGVAYYTDNYGLDHGRLVVEADMGDVDFTPSRESLHMTPRTKEYLKELTKYANKQLVRTIQRRIDASASMREVIELADQIPGNRGLVSWMGSTHLLNPIENYFLYMVRSDRCTRNEKKRIEVAGLYDDNAVIMINKPFTPMSSLQRKKLNKYFDENGLDYTRVYYFENDSIPFLGREATVIDFNDINAVEMEKKPRVSRLMAAKEAAEAKYDHWTFDNVGNSYRKIAQIDPNGKTIFYVRGKRSDPWSVVYRLDELHDDSIVVVWIEANRENRFLKAFPQAKPAADAWQYIQDEAQRRVDTLTEEDWLLYGLEGANHLSWIQDKTSDPYLTRLAKAYEAGNFHRVERFVSSVRQTMTKPDTVVLNENYITENYPLISSYHKTESIEYINLMYNSTHFNGKERVA